MNSGAGKINLHAPAVRRKEGDGGREKRMSPRRTQRKENHRIYLDWVLFRVSGRCRK